MDAKVYTYKTSLDLQNQFKVFFSSYQDLTR